MRRLFAAATLACFLFSGCTDVGKDGSADRAATPAAEAAARAAEAKGKPAVPESPPARTVFSGIDDAWTVLSQAAVQQNTQQIWAAIRWLAAQGQPAADRMTAIMNDPAAKVGDRLAACMVLGEMGANGRQQIIAAGLSSDLFNVRARVAETLGKVKPPTRDTVDALIEMLDVEKDSRVQFHVIRALAEVGEPAEAAFAKLDEIRKGSDDKVLRDEAHRALTKVHPRRDFTDLPLQE